MHIILAMKRKCVLVHSDFVDVFPVLQDASVVFFSCAGETSEDKHMQ